MIGKLIPYIVMILVSGVALWRDAPYATLVFMAVTAAWCTVRMVLADSAPLSVREERDAARERALTTGVAAGMFLVPLVALATPILDFAAYAAFPGQLILGVLVAVVGCYVFWRSHADLGSMWSPHLELREGHALVTRGIYRRMRHPMYTAIFLITMAQALLLANWLAGPAGFAAFALLYVVRIGPEERMMADQFGAEWEAYAARTPRLVPGLAN